MQIPGLLRVGGRSHVCIYGRDADTLTVPCRGELFMCAFSCEVRVGAVYIRFYGRDENTWTVP